MGTETSSSLSQDEQERMRRLAQEVAARYFEMATIMERALKSAGLRERAFAEGSQITLATKSRADGGSYLCIEVGSGHWEDPPGICANGPCPPMPALPSE